MGEYGIRKSDKQEIKIGTCESNYYVRLEDKEKVIPNDDSGFGYFWRLPLPNEDGILPGNYDGHVATITLDYPTFGDLEPGSLQMKHSCGLLANVPCYHGEKLPNNTDEMSFFWNGKAGCFYELRFLKTEADKEYAGIFEKVKPVVWCKVCHNMWSFDWKDIWAYIPVKLRERFLKYVSLEELEEIEKMESVKNE